LVPTGCVFSGGSNYFTSVLTSYRRSMHLNVSRCFPLGVGQFGGG
jgi:hypothetical protein